MECSLQDKIANGIRNSVRSEVEQTNMFNFNERRNLFIPKYQDSPDIIQKVSEINQTYGDNVFRKIEDGYRIIISSSLVQAYEALNSPKISSTLDLLKKYKIDDMESENTMNKDSLFSAIHSPQISEFTYEKLVSFLRSINPNLKIEEIDNLSTDAVSFIKEFVIGIRTGERLRAMPEEVGHFFIELLPDDNQLKKDMISNITNFEIYSETFKKYSTIYVKENGKPDIEKIKKEAAGKLIGEYITAISENNYEKVNKLVKVKEGWLRKWLRKLLEFFNLNIISNPDYKYYYQAANEILKGEASEEYKSDAQERLLNESFTDSYFFKITEEEFSKRYSDNTTKLLPLSEKVVQNLSNSQKLSDLIEVVKKIKKEFNTLSEKVEKEAGYELIKENLTIESKNTSSTINALSLLQRQLDIAYKDIIAPENAIKGFYEFLDTVYKLDLIADAVYDAVTSKEKVTEFDEAFNNINELQSYTKIYYTLKNMLDKDLVEILSDSQSGKTVLDVIKQSTSKFDVVTEHILRKQREYFKPLFSELLSFTRDKIGKQLQQEYKDFEMQGNEVGMAETMKKIESFVKGDKEINDFLLGLGSDMNLSQQVGYWASAAIANGDIYVSSIANFIQQKVKENEVRWTNEARDLQEKVDALGVGQQAHVIGKEITTVSKKYDPISKDGSPMEVLTFLNPVKYNEYYIEERKLNEVVYQKYKDFIDIPDSSVDEKNKAREEWKKAKLEFNNFVGKFKFRKYNKEYYSVFERYSKNALFLEQLSKWESDSNLIREKRASQIGVIDAKDLENEIAQLVKIRSYLLSDVDVEGNQKEGDELERARLLKEYFNETSKFKEIDQVASEENFNIGLASYMQKVNEIVNGITSRRNLTVGQFESELKDRLNIKRFSLKKELNSDLTEEDIENARKQLEDKWVTSHTRVVIKQQYWDNRKFLIEELNRILQRPENQESETLKVYKRLYELLQGSKDDINQINPESLTREEVDEILIIEQQLIDMKKTSQSKDDIFSSFYTEEDRQKIEELERQLENPAVTLMQARALKKRIFRIKRKEEYLKNEDIKTVKSIFRALGEMKASLPTEYYWEKMDDLHKSFSEYHLFLINQISLTTDPKQKETFKIQSEFVDKFIYDFGNILSERNFDELQFDFLSTGTDNAQVLDLILNGNTEVGIPSISDALSDKSEVLDSVIWFLESHLQNAKLYNELEETYTTVQYIPSRIYLETRPSAASDYELSYSKLFTETKIKDEYYTGYNPKTGKVELKVGYHIDNRGSFLPLPKEENPATNQFINEEYYTLKNSQSTKFKYLELITDQYLKDQEKVDPQLRRYLDVPVMSLTEIESYAKAKTIGKQKLQEIQSAFSRKEDKESVALEEQEKGFAQIKQYDERTGLLLTEVVPSLGMGQRVPVEFVSTNVLRAVLTFGKHAQDFSGRRDVQPFMEALINVLETSQKGTGNKKRIDVLRRLYKKNIIKDVPSGLVNDKFVTKAVRAMLAGSSYRLMFNPVGGAVNYAGATINNLIEAFAGKYVNIKEYSLGSIDAGKMTTAIVADWGKSSNLSYWTLLYQTFDFVQGDHIDDLLDRTSITDKLVQFRQMSMMPMKAGELKAQSSMALGILHRAKVKDDKGNSYPFHQIYEKKGNQLVLKPGFDPVKYNPENGTEFLRIRNIIHKINLDLHGNYAKINSSELSRYSFGKLAENMKKWFVPALQRRFGAEGLDVVTEEMDGGGYYRTGALFIGRIIWHSIRGDLKGAGNWANYYLKTDRYKRNLTRFSFDLLIAAALFAIYGLALGFSGDDRKKKLKENGLATNLAILIFLRIHAEHTSYLPIPGFGFQELKRNIFAPFSLQADTVSNWFGVGQLLFYHGLYALGADGLEKDLFYQKDAGYWYSEKGDAKIWKYIFKSFGYSGYTLEPIQFIKDFDSLQSRLK
jgi:hypothetical protein